MYLKKTIFHFQGYRTIGFYGNGFAKYKAATLPGEKGDISLSFRTTQRDALLLLAYDNDQRVSAPPLFYGKVLKLI